MVIGLERGIPSEDSTRSHFGNIHSSDRTVQGEAYSALMEATLAPVEWAYEVWDELLEALSHKDNRKRSIAGQIFCNLSKSDPQGRMLGDFARVLAATKDEKFVTARHILQAIWRVGAVGKKHQTLVMDGLSERFRECSAEKNCTPIRYDILECLRRCTTR